MKDLQISRYIKQYLFYIIGVCLLLTFLVYTFLNRSQSYQASAVIKYEYSGIKDGLAPDGTKLDFNDIKTSAIMTKVTDILKLDNSQYSTDSLIMRIKTEAILEEDEEVLKEAKLDEGEEYKIKPDTVIVSFNAKNNEGPVFARKVLDTVLNTYFTEFGKQYLNTGSFTNPISRINNTGYDYVEMMDIINTSTIDTIKSLKERTEEKDRFRSAATGCSFADLASRFQYIKNTKIASIYAKIFEYQITDDKTVLNSDYRERITQNKITYNVEQKQVADLAVIINDYLDQMKESTLTAEVTDPLYDHNAAKYNETDEWGWKMADHTITYDKQIISWRDHSINKMNAEISSKYYSYVLQQFINCRNLCGNTCNGSGKTCIQVSNADYNNIKKQIDRDIDLLVAELTELYDDLETTNDEYNDFLGQSYISTISTVSVNEDLNIPVYMTIAFFFLVIVCCGSAIIIGRLNDIISYTFFTDHLTGLNNRQSLDNYLKTNSGRILDDGTVCIAVTIKNQPEINKALGRQGGDSFLKYISDLLSELLSQNENIRFYNGSSQFIAYLSKTDYLAVEYLLQRLSLLLNHREKFTDIEIKYSAGLAETSRNEIRSVRGLLSKAITGQTEYTSKVTNQ